MIRMRAMNLIKRRLSLAVLQMVLLLGLEVVSVAAPAVQSFSVTAIQAKRIGRFDLGIGSEVLLQLPSGESIQGIFLGDLIEPKNLVPGNSIEQLMFLDPKKTRIYLVPRTETSVPGFTAIQAVLNPYPQISGTCAAYAMFHYYLQMLLSASIHAPALAKALATEEGRTQLLVSFVNRYYIERTTAKSLVPALNYIGKPYGIHCSIKSFTQKAAVLNYIRTQLGAGFPVLMAFNIGSSMVESTYEVTEFDRRGSRDPRLWIPRKIGQTNGGGHAIVLTASFQVNRRSKVLVLDSDWAEPRIWDLEKYIGPKTDVKTLEFYSCQSGG
jgi:hypothetical protein